MSRTTTVNELLLPMMGKPSLKLGRCAVCGAGGRLEQHHVVRRGAGTAYDERGRELSKPTVTLCGFGNAGGCHGLAHSQRLHFRWADAEPGRGAAPVYGAGHWEALVTDEPTRYQDALAMGGWRRV